MAIDTVPNSGRFTSTFNPPHGFPFVILPADPIKEQTTKRPRLATNVVCMFMDEREPVTNGKRRGRLPGKVTRLQIWGRIRAGVYCYFWSDKPNPNHGRVVYVLGRSTSQNYADNWVIRSVGAPLTTWSESDTGMVSPIYTEMEANAKPHHLRRCAPPIGRSHGDQETW